MLHRLRALQNLALILATIPVCVAADLQARVEDADGRPIVDVVLIAKSAIATTARPAPTGATAIVDQLNKEFVPEILVVRTGTAILFPNSDAIAHQVYSFSPAKRFTLPLYRGRPYPPQIFDQAGIVTLGCNIHDHMVGYIVVTDSPYFAQSDEQGKARIKNLPSGDFEVSVWHPRFDEAVPDQRANVTNGDVAMKFRLTKPMQSKRSTSKDRRIRDY
jgi:plastocyanin